MRTAAEELAAHRAGCSICRTQPFRCDEGQYLRKCVAISDHYRWWHIFRPLDVS